MTKKLDSPKSLNSLREHKLTRRKVIKAASAVGFSSAVAMNMTTEDVKAADSDQVTVSFDISGNSKHTVDADRMEWQARASEATKKLQKAYSGKKGIKGIGTRGGGSKDNPHVMVTLDNNSNKKEERRGEIPEEENGVRVETQEDSDKYESELHCDADHWSQDKDLPGGQYIRPFGGGGGTSSCYCIQTDYNWHGWTTAAHLNCVGEGNTVRHYADNKGYDIGTVDHIDTSRDLMFIRDDYHTPDDWNIKPSDHSEGVEITGTVTEEGFSTIDQEYDGQDKIFLYGNGTCFVDAELHGWNETVTNDKYDCTPDNQVIDQMVLEKQYYDDSTSDGNSGGLWFTNDPENPEDWFALGSHNGKAAGRNDKPYGAQGFTMHEVYDRLWK